MRGFTSFILAGALIGCTMPSPEFRGLSPTYVDVDGSKFAVRVRGNWAESIRTNPQYAPRLGPVRDRAVLAMTAASGCRVVDLLGDQAVQLGHLDCGDGVGWPLLIGLPANYDCLEVSTGLERSDGSAVVDFECAAYWR